MHSRRTCRRCRRRRVGSGAGVVAAGGVRGGLRRCGPVDGALLGLRGVGVSEMGVGGGGGGGRGAVHSGGGNGRRVHGRAVQTLIVLKLFIHFILIFLLIRN